MKGIENMKIAKILITLQIILVLFSANVFGVVTRTLSSGKKGFYDNGVYDGIMLTEQGSLTLAPIIEQNGIIAGKDIWKMYPANDGSMFAAISGSGAERGGPRALQIPLCFSRTLPQCDVPGAFAAHEGLLACRGRGPLHFPMGV